MEGRAVRLLGFALYMCICLSLRPALARTRGVVPHWYPEADEPLRKGQLYVFAVRFFQMSLLSLSLLGKPGDGYQPKPGSDRVGSSKPDVPSTPRLLISRCELCASYDYRSGESAEIPQGGEILAIRDRRICCGVSALGWGRKYRVGIA
ncbi:hypothetical protein LZ30DRAFT_290373 [Colletotrichum cereale]|nr:hypothetical protein LZ30DRAFT_290373 [Colletotrichum cereale]